MNSTVMVEVSGLCKRYGNVDAVIDVSFAIPKGYIFGLLGPNGAGKTSIIEMIEGIRTPDAGTIRIDGLDPIRQPMQVRQIIGAQLQSTALPDQIRVREVFRLFASFYANPLTEQEVLEMVALEKKRNVLYSALSGGEKQRVALGLAMIGNPKMVFLDEPTAGLDVGIRKQLHELILRMRADGRSVLISTHYIEEAERLCDLVAIVDNGRLKAIAPPQELVRLKSPDEQVHVAFDRKVEVSVLENLQGVSRVDVENGHFILFGPSAVRIATAAMGYSDKNRINIEHIRVVQASLEDAYLRVTNQEVGR